MSNRSILLAQRPSGKLELSHFRTVEEAMPSDPEPGEVLCRTILLSISPGSRTWMNEAPSYRDSGGVGEPMSAYTLAEVVAENGTTHEVGSVVACQGAWQSYSLLPESAVEPVRVQGPLTHHMSVYGANGLTAYFGMLKVGQPKVGQTVVVSAAAGSVGSFAGQLARRAGARVVGVTGSDDKGRLLTEKLGFDAAVNHRGPDFADRLAAACGEGIDAYFDNTGGVVLETVLEQMNDHGRVVCCGAVSLYDGSGDKGSTKGVPLTLVWKRLRMEGFLVFDFIQEFPRALEELAGWVDDGELVILEDVRDGIDSAPAALVDLLNGRNIGKVMVRVGPDA